MRIACSSCNAAYDVPPERVPPGKGVKCARCGTVWVPVERVDARPAIEAMPDRVEVPAPPVLVAASPVVQGPAEEVVPAPAVPTPVEAPVRSSRLPVLLGWLLSFAVLGGLAWAAVRYQAAITQAWPNAERAYALVGLR